MADQDILIVGGGLGGLGLAQILKKHGVSYQIFDRDNGIAQHQGWAVALEECLGELESNLPDGLGDIRATSPNFSRGINDAALVFNAYSGSLIAKVGDVPKGQPGYFVRAHRSLLRQYLHQGIDVQLGKKFTHYVEDTTGVTAHFSDGTQARGRILVGFDGASSKVRKQLLDGETASIASYVPITGSCTITDHNVLSTFLKITENAFIAVGDKVRVVVGTLLRAPDDSSVMFHYTLSYRPENAKLESEWIQKASQQDLFQKMLNLLKGFHEPLATIIRHAGPDSVLIPQTKFFDFVPPERLPSGRVTLAGDAGHTMMPFKGAGANTALLDACDLARAILSIKDDSQVATALRDYSSVMCPRGRKMVLDTRDASEDATKMIGVDRQRPQNLVQVSA